MVSGAVVVVGISVVVVVVSVVGGGVVSGVGLVMGGVLSTRKRDSSLRIATRFTSSSSGAE